mgnify:CR=1 FL=1
MSTKEMLERAKEAFRTGYADVRRRVVLAEGVRRYRSNKDLEKAYVQGYARAVKEIADEARDEKKKRGRYEFR